MLIFQEVYSASDLDDGIKLPSKEEIFGRVHEITAQYQDENEKIMQQIKDHQVSPTPTPFPICIFNICCFRRKLAQSFRINLQHEDKGAP